jgi:hypothetical protein
MWLRTLHAQKEFLSQTQNPLQRGFTERSSSTNAAYLLTEATLEAKDNKTPLYVTLLDASKAFDVVWHSSMLVSMYHQGVKGDVWCLAADAYKNMTSRVKWKGQLSRSISEKQGIRQGGLQSTEHFKARSNPLLDQLTSTDHGYRIGTTPVGTPTCANDMAIISDSLLGMQVMLDLSAQDSAMEKYTYSQAKSKVLIYNTNIKMEDWRDIQPLQLAASPIEVVAEQEHLGVIRTANNTSQRVKERIILARRSMYALMGAGMHGLNGLSTVVSHKLWTTYIIPRMTHTLEATKLRKTEIQQLDQYQTTVLKQLQHLPTRTSNAAIHLLLGAVPVSAHIHRAVYTFFCSMAREQESVEYQVLTRQLSVKGPSSNSWVNTLRDIICDYDLPSAFDVLSHPLTKGQVKTITQKGIMEHWVKKLKREATHQITVRYLNLEKCGLGKPHHIWSSLGTNSREVKMACVKVKLAVGQYNLQTAKQYSDPLCQLCKQEPETTDHFTLRCPVLEPARAGYLEQLREILQQEFPEAQVKKTMGDSQKLVHTLLDCTSTQADCSGISSATALQVEGVSRHLFYSLHLRRQKLLGPCGQRCQKDAVCPRCTLIDPIDAGVIEQQGLDSCDAEPCGVPKDKGRR